MNRAPLIEALTFTHPAQSSDFCLEAVSPDPTVPAAVYAACDMIGRPQVLPWRNYMRRARRDFVALMAAEPPSSLDALTALVRRVLRHHNDLVRAIRERHDRSAFGFCIALAAIYAGEARIFWLGDCRAYTLGAEGPRCLTRDQNRLHAAVAGHTADDPLVLFKNEILELSRHLEGFLGMSDTAAMDALLDAQDVRLRIAPGAALLLTTDGLYMPIVRERMEVTNYRITAEDLYIEKSLAQFFEEADCEPHENAADRWMNRAVRVARAAVDIGRRRPRYRDDIAMILLHADT